MVADIELDRTLIQRRRPSAPEMVAHALLVHEAGSPPRRIGLAGEPVMVGRAPANTLVLASPDISRQHCRIALAGGAAVLTDCGSTNGVYLDGARVRGSARLHPGARIAIGPYLLTYHLGSAADIDAAETDAREQARAVSYVRALLPPHLHDGPVRAAWRFEPSALLGGDAFGYRWLDDSRFAVFLLDVSGHGIGSALLAASAANVLRAPVLGADPADPLATLHAANAAFQMDNHDGLMFSLWYGVFDRGSHTLRYACAGHHPAFLQHGPRLVPLATRGPCIGMMPSARFTASECLVPAGASLHLFSDGAFEVDRLDGRPGAVEDIPALLADPDLQRSGPDGLWEAIRETTGRRPFEDDVSLLRLEFI